MHGHVTEKGLEEASLFNHWMDLSPNFAFLLLFLQVRHNQQSKMAFKCILLY